MLLSETGKDLLFTPEEVALALKIAEQTLARWRFEGTGPNYIRMGGKVRYFGRDVQRFVTNA